MRKPKANMTSMNAGEQRGSFICPLAFSELHVFSFSSDSLFAFSSSSCLFASSLAFVLSVSIAILSCATWFLVPTMDCSLVSTASALDAVRVFRRRRFTSWTTAWTINRAIATALTASSATAYFMAAEGQTALSDAVICSGVTGVSDFTCWTRWACPRADPVPDCVVT